MQHGHALMRIAEEDQVQQPWMVRGRPRGTIQGMTGPFNGGGVRTRQIPSATNFNLYGSTKGKSPRDLKDFKQQLYDLWRD